ncbi:MAG: hybrid sensor histidine kinase/response regulator [Candidatus Hodarchaeales archaeon]
MPQILLIDDDSYLLAIAKEFLHKECPDFEIETRTSAQAALHLLTTHNFDVIVSDYQMEGMDGLKFLKVLRNRGDQTPIIILTGRGREEIVIQALNLGANHYIKKEGRPKTLFRELAHIIQTLVQQKETEQALRESEKKFQVIFDQSLVGVAIFQAERIIYINTALLELIDYPKDEIWSWDFDNFANVVYPEDRELVTFQFRQRLAGEMETLTRIDFRITTKGGLIKWVTMHVNELELGGMRTIAISAIDITESKSLEDILNQRIKELGCLYGIAIVERSDFTLPEKLQEAIQLLPQGYQHAQIAEGCITVGNQRFATENFQESPWIQKTDIEVREKKIGEIIVSYAEKRPDVAGGEGPFLIEERQLIEATAERLGLIIERSQFEETLRQQKEELSEFAHAMNHDLKNYLFAIRGYADLLQTECDSSYPGKIHQMVQGMSALLQRSVALADAGLVIKKTDKVDLASLMKEVAESIIPENVDFSLNDLPAVQGDYEKLAQVFQNLFDNALIHGEPRRIEVHGLKLADGINIHVRNDGIPISVQDRSKIFQRGFTTKEGQGLGLTIAQKIIKAHGWEVELLEGPETIFRIFIPKGEQ